MPAVASEQLVLLLAGWSAGISVYLTTALLGISGRFGWIQLPGDLAVLSNPLIFIVAALIFAVEFFADKIPFVDSAWDSVHTIIRPLGGLWMGYAAGAEHGVVMQTLYALMTGTITLNMHAFKASSRLAINTSPEPFSNIAASITENSAVFFMYWLFIKHPWLAAAIIVVLLIISFLILKLLWKFVKKLFTTKPKASPV